MAGRRPAGARPLAPKGSLRLFKGQGPALDRIAVEDGVDRSELIRRAVDLLLADREAG